MAPEMAASYIIGWIPCCTVTGLQFWLHRKKVRSSAEALQILQECP